MTLAHDATASGGLRVLADRLSDQAHSHSPYYLPHHGVLKPDSSTTKLRVVFNGSSPSSSGKSLNDIMHTGAKLQPDTSDVLLWIRRHRILFSTDITKMYRQIMVHRDDWDLQRILWVDDQLNITPYQLTTVTYGTRSAPFLAGRTLMQLVTDEGDRFPLAVPALTKGRYVDDIFGGADSIDELLRIAHQVTGICTAGRFPLAKWHSNHSDFRTPSTADSSTPSMSPISFEDCAKILGLNWNPREDVFQFVTKFAAQSPQGMFTKRRILSEIAQVFDPLGFLSPVVIRAKMLLQELWLEPLNWDDSLPPRIVHRWLAIRSDLQAQVSVPRWMNTLTCSTVEIRGFSDASQLAMAAAVSVVVRSPGLPIQSSLVMSKTKMAPLKRLTIPRLELTAALLLSRLVRYVQNACDLAHASTYLWTDSSVTLAWVKSHSSRWKDFVRNRVSSIQETTPSAQWRYVPGSENPAECASRGISTDQLTDHALWWTGPPWLTKPAHHWPAHSPSPDSSMDLEVRPELSLVAAKAHTDYQWDLIYKYSSLVKLLRVTATLLRVLRRLRQVPDSSLATPLTLGDLHQARIFWAKATQAAYFAQEIRQLTKLAPLPSTHPFTRLTAFIDHDGVIRVGGRLKNALLDDEDVHHRTLHGGVQLMLPHIRRHYWIIGGRSPVKAHVLRCVRCAGQREVRAQQLMGQLPMSRVTPSRPFTHTGVDYAGPITVKTWRGRGAKVQKGWICVFVCFVHLELVGHYSSDGFIAAYRRLVARRGICHTLYSDCGTTFVGSSTEMKRLFIQSSQENHRLADLLASDGTRWQFNPPAALIWVASGKRS